MRLLLDTHIVLWWRLDSRRLPPAARRAISTAESVFVSAASAWEIAIKQAIGRLSMADSFAWHVQQAAFSELPITFEHAAEAGRLPPHHADPFDRMLVAQARQEQLVLVTHDAELARYDVQVLNV